MAAGELVLSSAVKVFTAPVGVPQPTLSRPHSSMDCAGPLLPGPPSHPASSPPSGRKVWGDPSEFRPERFLTANGTAINKPLSEKVTLFGMGKRRCIGETLGRWEVFLFLAMLLQRLEFSVPPGLPVDLTPIYGLTMKHPHCKHVQVTLRFSTQ